MELRRREAALSLFFFFGFSALVFSGCSKSAPDILKLKNEPHWSIFALEYGHSTGFRRSALVKGAPRGKRQPLSWMVWLLVGRHRVILVDTGFNDPELADKWRFDRFQPVPEILAELKIRPHQITDVILTHLHWDHAGDTFPYKNARFWIQKGEYDWAGSLVGREVKAKSGIRFRDVRAITRLIKAKRAELIEGDRELFPGVSLHVGGGHTKRIQWIEIETGREQQTVILASDIAYLFENIETLITPGSTLSPAMDLEQIKKMRSKASNINLILPGHDPEVFSRFPLLRPNIVEIR